MPLATPNRSRRPTALRSPTAPTCTPPPRWDRHLFGNPVRRTDERRDEQVGFRHRDPRRRNYRDGRRRGVRGCLRRRRMHERFGSVPALHLRRRRSTSPICMQQRAVCSITSTVHRRPPTSRRRGSPASRGSLRAADGRAESLCSRRRGPRDGARQRHVVDDHTRGNRLRPRGIDGSSGAICTVGACGTQGVVWNLVDGAWVEVYRGDVPLAAVSVAGDGTIHAAGPMGGARFVSGAWEAVTSARASRSRRLRRATSGSRADRRTSFTGTGSRGRDSP